MTTKIKKGDELLKRFMKEHFPYGPLKKCGLFTKEMKNDYSAQAERICDRLCLKSIYEYRSEEIRCHITYAEGSRPVWIDETGELKTEPFVTVIPNIYE